MAWEKDWKANMDAYSEQYDIEVVCQAVSHDERVHVGTFTRVDSRMRAPSAHVSLRDDFVPVGAGVHGPDDQRRQHDGGQHSTSLTHDGDQPLSRYQSTRRPTREHYELECRQCGHKVPVRNENIQPVLKEMEGKSTVLTLRVLESLLQNSRR